MAETKRLVSTDGALAFASFGTQIDGDGSTTLATGWFVPTAIAGTTGLLTGSQVGIIFYSDSATNELTPAVGDSVIPITFTKQCDLTSGSIEYTKGEINITTLCDTINTYRAGRTDATGTIEGITTVGLTNEAGGLANKFITLVKENAGRDTLTVSEINREKIYLQLEINKESTEDEDTAFYFLPVELFGFNSSVQTEDNAQTFSSNVRVTADDLVSPVLFTLETPVV